MQQLAVDHDRGPCLTIAGPGSGKTTVLTQRIISLISSCYVSPERILVITFTKDAALEMKRRCLAMPPVGQEKVAFGTFHSVFFQILKEECGYSNADLLYGGRRLGALRECGAACGLRGLDEAGLNGLAKEISFIVNGEQNLQSYHPEDVATEQFSAFFHTYQNFKQTHHLIDFDDMLTVTRQILQENTAIRGKWQSRFDRILVDEGQDMNPVQFQTIRLLAGREANLFVVGDDDQSIYRFRGADPGILLSFDHYYPECKRITLSNNYRSAPEIVSRASKLISHNGNRYEKEIVSKSLLRGLVRIYKASDPSEEATRIVRSIEKKLVNCVDSSCAILFRTGSEAHPVILELTRRRIPFHMKENLHHVYAHPVTRDILSYLKIACGIAEPEAYLRVMNKPLRYLSRRSFDMSAFSWEKWAAFYRQQPWMQARVELLHRQMMRTAEMSPFAAINYIRHAVGYEECLDRHNPDDQEDKEIADELQSLAAEYKGRGYRPIQTFIGDMERKASELQQTKIPDTTEGVGLYTFHGAKGLEFDRVYILDANEMITPSRHAQDQDALEEERRMFYVAMTRAKSELYIYCIERRNNERLAPSRFLTEMME